MNILLLLFLSAFLLSCEQVPTENDKKSPSFCECFSASNIENFDDRANSCLPEGVTRSEGEGLIISNIKSCDAVFTSLSDYQDEMIRYGSKMRTENYHETDSTSLLERYLFFQDHFILSNDFDSVLFYCEKAEEIEPYNSENLFAKGFAYEKLAQFDKAIAVYKKLGTMSEFSASNMLIAIAETKKVKSK